MVLLRKLQTAWGVAQSYWRGWRCCRKIVVIESDDWGSIRTSSREAYDRLVAAGYPMGRSAFGADALETIRRCWPDVYFLSSAELGRMVDGGLESVEDLER